MKIQKTNEEWREILAAKGAEPLAFKVTRQESTESFNTGRLLSNEKDGVYACICCDKPLFSSEAKYDSGTGWPSYYEPIDAEALGSKDGAEVHCSDCGAHLGHVFGNETTPTGLRYCINSAALGFGEKL